MPYSPPWVKYNMALCARRREKNITGAQKIRAVAMWENWLRFMT
jgi:hypothetical protein